MVTKVATETTSTNHLPHPHPTVQPHNPLRPHHQGAVTMAVGKVTITGEITTAARQTVVSKIVDCHK